MIKLMLETGLILALIWAPACAAGTRNGQTETVSGTIRVVGNEPFTHVIIRPASRGDSGVNQDILIMGPLAEELRSDFQGKSVTLKGTSCTSPTPQFARCFKPSKITVD